MTEQVDALARRIAREELVTAADILGRKRYPRVTAARHRLWHVVQATFGLTYSEVARMFRVDHTAVMHGIRRHELRLEREL